MTPPLLRVGEEKPVDGEQAGLAQAEPAKRNGKHQLTDAHIG
jgi:hypothetical protein